MDDGYQVHRAPIAAQDATRAEAARQRQARLTKPSGSLGRLEELSIRLAGMGCDRIEHAVAVVFAADHGVAEAGVSAYPRDVTRQMLRNFAAGGAAVNVLAREQGARLLVVDTGVAGEATSGVLDRRLAPGTRNMLEQPAMTRELAVASLGIGADVFSSVQEQPVDLVIGGEMGIGNTTAASATCAVLLSVDPELVTGRGTGIDDRHWQRKVDVVRSAVSRHAPRVEDPLGVLAAVGGFEIGALAGFYLAAARAGVPVLLDGFISGAAALLAQAIAPNVTDWMIASHKSVEPGHALILKRLGLRPLLELDLRLGEGSGALLALPLLRSSLALLNQMATFDEAGVSDRA